MKKLKILETCLYVDDLEAAERFYSQVLGLHAFRKNLGRHIFFRCESSVLLLFNPDVSIQFNPNEPIQSNNAPQHGAHGPGHVCFEIQMEDVSKWRKHLDQHKIVIEAEFTWPNGGYSIYFRDPAGNSIELGTARIWE